MRISIVIPAFRESSILAQTIRAVQDAGYSDIVVVDDGSGDTTGDTARMAGARVITHRINRGVGAATMTGMLEALRAGADVVVTFDADGQHIASDISGILAPIRAGEAEVVLGVRTNWSRAPLLRRIANAIANVVTWLLAGLRVQDSQSGFRAYTRHAIEVMDLHANGYEFCSEVIREIRHHRLRFVQIPVQVCYTEHSLSKGQNFDTGIGTLAKLIIRSLMR